MAQNYVLASRMSEAVWYRNKAAQCGRMADSATDADVRDGHLREQHNWIEIAKSIESAETAVKPK
jgi:hypothetical protein